MKDLVKELTQSGWLTNPRVRRAFLKIDRADFVPASAKSLAHINEALSIGRGQTISQPAVVAFMLGLLDPRPGQVVLDVGAGSGWQTALLAKLVGIRGKVYAIEVIPQLCQLAQENLSHYDFSNIEFICRNARRGLSKQAPFDGIIAGASAKGIPESWKRQLGVGGRLVMPVGTDVVQLRKISKDKFVKRTYSGFIFVPLV
ncbi:protein-L-isoaspartate O-methyltransferase [candidate division Kazan bacterium RIFCSPHIGHO2_01_FULL_49_10]|uniref:Protein-L-isoaspartate O-methyltransferase n=1 Tax=candidate division Kazan bacterium RIFCSPLOWO2_01_FULL_48_13 TaxID=1798539 RepID=A0A1F4PN83_UNCK3|nr:MAG: protein-L-isoaspartate O-methyltransferase [candidate division Kazan bacterium RIFCSPHIGHO2_01_FULL_49_10]OGB85114.1 MAG: protein-L-isoaspartate O-methyltransferase [candidate division Kazan bacterium RIFCSPLOWO2_01_FULL_48_13]